MLDPLAAGCLLAGAPEGLAEVHLGPIEVVDVRKIAPVALDLLGPIWLCAFCGKQTRVGPEAGIRRRCVLPPWCGARACVEFGCMLSVGWPSA
jgi:hypothetical protein